MMWTVFYLCHLVRSGKFLIFSLLSQILQSTKRYSKRNIQNNILKQGLTGSRGCSVDLDSQICDFFLLSSLSYLNDKFCTIFFQPLQKNELYSDLGFKSSNLQCTLYMYTVQAESSLIVFVF